MELGRRHACLSFNPRPRAGGDLALPIDQIAVADPSIHAPAQGATKDALLAKAHAGPSIHAPAQGATVAFWRNTQPEESFNPRPRAGGDMSFGNTFPMSVILQSTPPRRGRLVPRERDKRSGDLQSTPPRRGRHGVTSFRAAAAPFNPRPRAGGDLNAGFPRGRLTLLQSTPPRRGRLGPSHRSNRRCRSFNPRPRAGGDRCILA